MRPAPRFRRRPDWVERLAALVEERRETPFYFGQQDCGHFAGDVAVAVTGEDPVAWLRGSYDDEEALEAILREKGGLEAALAATMADFGSPEIDPAFAMRGDWCLVRVGNLDLVGVVLGDVLAVTGLDGLRFVPSSLAVRAWAI